MKCEAHDIPAGAEFPMVWDWLDHAQYHRFEDHRTNKTYDAWSEHVSVVHLYCLATNNVASYRVVMVEAGHFWLEKVTQFNLLLCSQGATKRFMTCASCHSLPWPHLLLSSWFLLRVILHGHTSSEL